jgi:hypothetical protein
MCNGPVCTQESGEANSPCTFEIQQNARPMLQYVSIQLISSASSIQANTTLTNVRRAFVTLLTILLSRRAVVVWKDENDLVTGAAHKRSIPVWIGVQAAAVVLAVAADTVFTTCSIGKSLKAYAIITDAALTSTLATVVKRTRVPDFTCLSAGITLYFALAGAAHKITIGERTLPASATLTVLVFFVWTRLAIS